MNKRAQRIKCQMAARLLAALLGLLITHVVCSEEGSQESDAPARVVLRHARQVLSLDHPDLDRKILVELEGVVTCYDERTSLFWIQDETAGIFVYPNTWRLGLHLGERVAIMGTASPGRFSPIIAMSALRRLGPGELPQPKRISLPDFASGAMDSQWVEVEGTVHSARADWGHLVLDLSQGLSEISVRLLTFPGHWSEELIDAQVRIRGIAASSYNQGGQLTGFHLIVPTFDQVEILTAPKRDPFTAPQRRVQELLRYSPEPVLGQRVCVRGNVTLWRPGVELYLSDQTGALRIRTHQTNTVHVGDRVEVSGFPEAAPLAPELRGAVFRVVASGESPRPKAIGDQDLLQAKFAHDLVSLDGWLESWENEPAGPTVLRLLTGKALARVEVPASPKMQRWLPPQPGARLRATGVAAVQANEDNQVTSFVLLSRSPEDIDVLQPAPWWTPRRLRIAAIGICCLIVIVVAIYARTLNARRQVAAQRAAVGAREEELEARFRDLFENANDVIFTHDLSGKLLSLNRAGELLLGCTREQAIGTSVDSWFGPACLTNARQLADLPTENGKSIRYGLELIRRDGTRRIAEILTRLEAGSNESPTVRCIARDITARKEATDALLAREQELRALLEERAQLGQDLHDGIIQSIYAVGLSLEESRKSLPEDPAQAETRLVKATADLNQIIREVRHYILRLGPEALHGGNLDDALGALIADLRPLYSGRLIAQLDRAAAKLLDPNQAEQLLHIAREALSNSVRHSCAQQTRLALSANDNHVRFEVIDDGRGFEPAAAKNRGRGLNNIATRAKTIHARLDVIARPDSGTAIILDIPTKAPWPHAAAITD